MNPVKRLCTHMDAVSSIDIPAGLHAGTRQRKESAVCLPTYYNRPADVTLGWRYVERYTPKQLLALVSVTGASAVACVA
jgi:hypothetical protein